MPAPAPPNEHERLAALRRYYVLDTPPEVVLDRITRLAARVFSVPISLVTLVDESRQWFKSAYGLDLRETPRDDAFCPYAFTGTLVVPNALEDPRFATNPLVTCGPHIRFYAGAPLTTSDGFTLGTLCIIDRVPRAPLDDEQRHLLESLAAIVMDELELRLATIAATHHQEQHAQAAERLSDVSGRLELSEQILTKALDVLPVGIWIADRDGHLVHGNPAAQRIWGGTRYVGIEQYGEYVGFWPETGERIKAEEWALARAIREGKASIGQIIEIQTFDGQRKVISNSAVPLRDAAGKIAGAVVVNEDITERIRAEKALALSEDRFRRAVLEAPLPVMIHDDSGRIVQLNRAWTALSGYGTDDVATVDDWMARACACTSGGLPRGEFPVQTRQGATRTWDYSSASLGRTPDGRRLFITMATDVTERRSLEQQLAQAQKMEAIGQLAGGVAHDFNNLLTVICGYSSLLEHEVGPALEPQVGEIARAADRARALTQQLLAFSRKQRLQPTDVDVNEVLRESEHMLRRLIGEDIVVRLALGSGVHARVDRGQLLQIVLNLAVNGRDAMPHGGTLTIETAAADLGRRDEGRTLDLEPGPYVRLTIRDTGCGIDPATLPRIFEPFFTTKPVGAGTGLGLATVYGIVKQSRGDVAVESQPGQGTTFHVYLPRTAPSEPAPRDDEAARAPGGTETVLLVEDDDALRRLAFTVLSGAGYHVIEAADPAHALALCGSGGAPIHLLLTDLIMPGMDGRELAAQFAARCPATRVLYMSGYADRAALAGPIEGDLLQKPFSPEELRRRVRAALDRA